MWQLKSYNMLLKNVQLFNYSLDCTNMLNCDGSCGNECKEFFQIHTWGLLVHQLSCEVKKVDLDLWKDIIKIYEEAIANQE